MVDFYCFCVPELKDDLWGCYEGEFVASDVFSNFDYDIACAKKLNKCLFYEIKSDSFIFNGEKVDIARKTIFPRCIIPEIKKLITKLEDAGAHSIVSLEDEKKIHNWIDYILPKHRTIIKTTKRDILDNFKKYKEMFGRVFIKTVEKGPHAELVDVCVMEAMAYSASCIESLLRGEETKTEEKSVKTYIMHTKDIQGRINTNKHKFDCYEEETPMFVQDFVEICFDDCFKKVPVEYRNFVIDGKLANTSHNYLYHKEVPLEVKRFAQKVVDSLPKEFPKNFAFDIMKVRKGGIEVYDICEFNTIVASGYGEYNSVFTPELPFTCYGEVGTALFEARVAAAEREKEEYERRKAERKKDFVDGIDLNLATLGMKPELREKLLQMSKEEVIDFFNGEEEVNKDL